MIWQCANRPRSELKEAVLLSRKFLIAALLPLMTLMACSAIHVETGPQTDAEATADSEDRARQLRISWANRLQNAPTLDKVRLIATFMDSSTSGYLRYGENVAATWLAEENRRGIEVPVEDIRRMVEVSNQTEWPIFEAYEDIIDHGLELIEKTREMPMALEGLLSECRDHNTEVFSAVMYPNGTREEYEDRIRDLRLRTDQLRLDLRDELNRL